LRDSYVPVRRYAGALAIRARALAPRTSKHVLAPAAALLALAPSAAGQTSGGGVVYVAKPKIAKVSCLRSCASRGRAQGGSTLMITGSALAAVTEVVFQGSYGSGDDAVAQVRSGGDDRVQARVPIGAVTGPIAMVTRDRIRSSPSEPIPILPPPPPTPNPELSPVPGPADPGAPRLETGTSRTKAYIGAGKAVTFSFRLSGPAPSALSVELVRAADGAPVKTWTPQALAPGEVQSVSWDGRLGAAAASPGRYAFRLTAAGADGSGVRSSQVGDTGRDAFDLYDHIFPVRGTHDFGGPGARFGAGRAGHSHQGQDIMAACGTPIVAARGGRVRFKQYHAAAGNYIVIDGAGTDVDYAYMHLAEPSPFAPGDHVYTGQVIGAVGETGNAQGCHLHFEMWGAPGWYDGGRPFDPLPSLTAWDSWS
jgi:murein DD-endopeptidase MepM/ murein hydrolase activator NlpD